MIASERSNKLLSQLQSGEYNLKAFLLECAYWALVEGFDELKPRVIPTKPFQVVELERSTFKSEVDWAKMSLLHPEVAGYFKILLDVKIWNKDVKGWLEELLTIIPQGDFPSREKIQTRLKEFTVEEDEVKKVKETFNAQSA